MKKTYDVYHIYDIDGGFGDACYNESKVATFESKADAEDFVERFENPHVYGTPYDELNCGTLEIRESEIVPKGADLDVIAFRRLNRDEFDLEKKMEIIFLFDDKYPVLFRNGKALALDRCWKLFIEEQSKEVGTNLSYEFISENFEHYEKNILESMNKSEHLNEILKILKGENA